MEFRIIVKQVNGENAQYIIEAKNQFEAMGQANKTAAERNDKIIAIEKNIDNR